MFGKLRLLTAQTLTLVVLSMLLISARPARAQTETVLYSFAGGVDGKYPTSRLTPDGFGNLYGTTSSGGLGYGTVFELSPDGKGGWNETVLYSFTGGADGNNPNYSYVTFDAAGNLYGTTYEGGANGVGVVFELSPFGKRTAPWIETVLFSFAGTDGLPTNGLIMDAAGNLYGTALYGAGYAEVFELSQSSGSWTKQVIYETGSTASNGGLTMDASGNIFGATYGPPGTIFELSQNGSGGWTTAVIRKFRGSPQTGGLPVGTVALDPAGNIYGAIAGAVGVSSGQIYRLSRGTNGVWTKTILHAFTKSGRYGSYPWSGVVLDAVGNIYGTTTSGGKYEGGTVFELVAPVVAGSYREKVLCSFEGSDGDIPYNSPILDSAGNLYGTTLLGGSGNDGVVFEVTP